jgi:hypothetical protein
MQAKCMCKPTYALETHGLLQRAGRLMRKPAPALPRSCALRMRWCPQSQEGDQSSLQAVLSTGLSPRLEDICTWARMFISSHGSLHKLPTAAEIQQKASQCRNRQEFTCAPSTSASFAPLHKDRTKNQAPTSMVRFVRNKTQMTRKSLHLLHTPSHRQCASKRQRAWASWFLRKAKSGTKHLVGTCRKNRENLLLKRWMINKQVQHKLRNKDTTCVHIGIGQVGQQEDR